MLEVLQFVIGFSPFSPFRGVLSGLSVMSQATKEGPIELSRVVMQTTMPQDYIAPTKSAVRHLLLQWARDLAEPGVGEPINQISDFDQGTLATYWIPPSHSS